MTILKRGGSGPGYNDIRGTEISEEEVSGSLKEVNPKTATGVDDVTPRVLKVV